jgi:hypothetical protein
MSSTVVVTSVITATIIMIVPVIRIYGCCVYWRRRYIDGSVRIMVLSTIKMTSVITPTVIMIVPIIYRGITPVVTVTTMATTGVMTMACSCSACHTQE